VVKIDVVVMTCLEPWVVDAIDSVNNQEQPFNKKYLLVDESFLDNNGKIFLESIKEKLSDWQIHVHLVDNDFASHKNWMLDKCLNSGEWILWLDADEVINKKFVVSTSASIKYSDEYSKNKIDTYALAFVHSFDGRDGELDVDWLSPGTWLYPDWHPRLFKNTKEIRFVGIVHEIINGWKTIATNSDPTMTIIHRKNLDMQDASNKRWRKLEALRREKDPNYLSHIQGEDWERFIREFED